MLIDAYQKLVLLTESPTSRIGRVAPGSLSEAERAVVGVLAVARLFERSWAWPDGEFRRALCAFTPAQVREMLVALQRVGLLEEAHRLRRVLAVLGVREERPETQTSEFLEGAGERRWRRAEQWVYAHPEERVSEILVDYIERNADAVVDAVNMTPAGWGA